MKKFLLPLLIFTSLLAQSQAYNNEWIDYSKTYYKFKVGATGLYRISQATLNSISIGNTPAEHFQLWRNGQQVPVYTTSATGPLGGSGYIEFWGEMNDGRPDSILYKYQNDQLNRKWSLETDTAAFFLTINTTSPNLRLVPTANTLPAAIPAEPFFIHTAGKYYRDRINQGYAAIVGEYVHSSAYDEGEGFTTVDIYTNVTVPYTFISMNAYTGAGAPAPVLKINAVGNALNPRTVEVKLNGAIIAQPQMDFFDDTRIIIPLSPTALNAGPALVEVTNRCLTTTNDRMVIAQTEIVYAHTFNVGGVDRLEFSLPANPAGNYLEISSFADNGVSPILYDMTNGKRYVCDITTPFFVKVLLEPSATERQLVLISAAPSVPVAVTAMQQRNFVNYAIPASQGDYLIITHPALQNGAGGNPVNDYKNYRSSAAGGSYNAQIYNVEELIDQYGFGIKNNPVAVRNFIRWARNTYSTPLTNVLLIGKGLNYQQFRANEANADINKLSFVPTFGQPASDNLLAAEAGPNEIPKVPIGRISAINPGEVSIYLAKLIQYEQAQAFSSPLIKDRAWLKNVAHVVGASDGALGAILADAMERYRQTIIDTFYGANVNTFSKLSAAPVEQASSERLAALFQEGIGVMTYFGHSSSSTLEFNLDNPTQYNNPGKYPVTIVMGCNAGNFYNFNPLRLITKETLSEKFVLADQRGSIAFVASSHFGIVHYLDILNTRTYNAATVSKYGKTLGQIMIESFTQVYNLTTQSDYYARFHCEQTTIHGDPALRLDGSTAKPDYVIEDQLLKVTPSFISVAEPSFRVDAKMMNIGKASNQPIVVELKRTYPNLVTEVIRRDTIPGIRYIDSLRYNIEIVPTRDKGLNRISICIDADNVVDELYETNNCITKDVFVYEDEARPVYPYTFAVVNRQDLKLVASTANPFSGLKQYVMEMDTTEFFNSSFKISRTISSTGGVLEFAPGVSFTDSTVYYWRVAPVPVSGQPVWNKSSFIFLDPAGANASDFGFNQSHFFQQTKSAYDKLKLDSATRKTNFGPVINNLFIRQGTWVTSGATQEASLAVSINGVSTIRLMCWFSSLVFNVFDPVSFKPWQNQTVVPHTFPTSLGQGLYGSTDNNCFGSPKTFNFEYRYTDTSSRRKMMDLMRDVIPNGHYVIIRNFTLNPIYNFPDAWAADWAADQTLHGPGQSLYHYIKNAGLSSIDSFYRARPWALVYKKGDPSFTPKWIMGEGMFDNPTLSVDCLTSDTVGYVTSPLFGPARAWKQLKWRGAGDPVGDLATMSVIGVKTNGTEDLLFNGITTSQQNFDVSSINAGTYPYVKLRMRTADSINFTPYQLRYWRITYTPVPEGAIAPNIFLKAKDTLEIGEPLDFRVAFKNISDVAFDSLKVKMVITDKNNVQHIIPISKRRPLVVNDTLQIGALVNTATLGGVNTMYLEANPDNDQLEQFHFNNFAYRSIYVKPDSLNPLLDVTFDGVHILNKDIVAAKPDILIKLKDEARWMILNDTALLTLHIRNMKTGLLRRYYFNNDTVQFTPAGQAPNPDNTATINFKPYFSEDGEYELIVTGKDKSNNTVGSSNDIEYRVLFEVINKPMISNMLNYPNPFTTSTAFVFTVTGSEVPQNIKIEIMTITGKIVREITKEELGPLHIGRNITEFKWDGTDQYGSKLANGIYLYRVVTNLNGKSLDKYTGPDDKTDKYFNKGYGKMYLMR